MNGVAKTSDAGLMEIFRFFLRNFWLIAGISLFCGVVTYGASFLMAPTYRAEITLVAVEESAGGAFTSLLSPGFVDWLATIAHQKFESLVDRANRR